jgi:hypothetical protein
MEGFGSTQSSQLWFMARGPSYQTLILWMENRGSSVSIVSSYGPGDRALIPGRDRYFFSSPPRQDWLWGPPSLLTNGYRALSPAIKRLGREADHSSPSRAEVKNAWSYTSIPPYVFMAWCLGSAITLPYLFIDALNAMSLPTFIGVYSKLQNNAPITLHTVPIYCSKNNRTW